MSLCFSSSQHLIIVTSIYAVKTAGAYLSKHHKAWLTKIPIIGIGPATAGALHAQGWQSVTYPKVYNSEGVLSLRATTHLRHKTVVILTGAHGRNLLTPELTTRGAKVIQVDGYERQPQGHISETALDLLAKQPALVVLTSVEAWQTLERLTAAKHPTSLTQATLIVASKRIAETIWQQHCQQTIIIANGASHEAIIAAITKETLL
jgi:uroporphyrinogen-III synthase